MKNILLIILNLLCCNYTFTQVEFPDNFKINPFSDDLIDLDVEEIIQYRVLKYKNTKTDTLIDYIFSHQKNHFSLKHDFQKDWQSKYLTIKINNKVTNDSLKSIWTHANTFLLFNEKKYYHNEKTKVYRDEYIDYISFDLDSIIYVKKPNQSNYNILDGVYIKIEMDTVSNTEKDIYFENRIIRKEFYINDTLFSTLTYHYKNYFKNGKKYKLLATIKGSKSKFASHELIEIKFEYKFSNAKKDN